MTPRLRAALAVLAALAVAGGAVFAADEAQDKAAREAEDAAAKTGEKLFRDLGLGGGEKSCSSCHDNPKKPELSLKGVGGRYPRYDQEAGKVLTLQEKFSQMLEKRLKGKKPIPLGDARWTSLEMYLKGLK